MVLSDHAHAHGESGVWRVRFADGQTAFLKQNKRRGKWACEVHAYEQWATVVRQTPMLLACNADLQTSLLSDVGGNDAEAVELTLDAEGELWRSAGAWLARLHAIRNDWLGAPNEDGSPQGEGYRDAGAFLHDSFAWRAAYAREKGLVTVAQFDRIEATLREGTAALVGERAYAVHRDFGPRNWRCDTSGQLLAVFDFEHSRWDLQAFDFNKVWDAELAGRPDLMEALFDGYGAPPDSRLMAQIQAVRLLGAVAGMVWSYEHSDAAYLAHNARVLERVIDEALE
jgi:aminoglycoside phosphotransferase (APT) family kinase protein